MFPYHPAHLLQTVDEWVDLQVTRWPLAAVRLSGLAQRSSVHVIGDRDRSFERHGLAFEVHRSRLSGPRYRQFGQDWSPSLGRVLKRLGPDDVCVLHLNAYDAAKMADLHAARTRLVVVFHGRGTMPWGPHPAGADRLLVLREDAAEELIQAGAAADRVLTVVPSIDRRIFSGPDGSSFPPGPPVAGFVGRADWAKGAFDIPPLVRALRAAGVDLSVELIGVCDRRSRDRIQRLVRSEGVQGRVALLGPLPPSEIAQRMRRWRVLLIPSHSEGFSLVALEASGMRIPLVIVAGVMPQALESQPGVFSAPRAELAGALAAALSLRERPAVPAIVHDHLEGAMIWDEILEGLGEWRPRRPPGRPTLRRLRHFKPLRRVIKSALRPVRGLLR